MKIINPLNIIQFLVVYVITVGALRKSPRVEGFNIGWASPNEDFQVFYNAQVNRLGIVTPSQETTWEPHGWQAWFNLGRAYLDLLDQVTAAFINAYLPEDDDESNTEGK